MHSQLLVTDLGVEWLGHRGGMRLSLESLSSDFLK